MSKTDKAAAKCAELQRRIQLPYTVAHSLDVLFLGLLVAWLIAKAVDSPLAVSGPESRFTLADGLLNSGLIAFFGWVAILLCNLDHRWKQELSDVEVAVIAKVAIGHPLEGRSTKYVVTLDDGETFQSAVPLYRVYRLAKSWETVRYWIHLDFMSPNFIKEYAPYEHNVPLEHNSLAIRYRVFGNIADREDATKLYPRFKSDAEIISTVETAVTQRFCEVDWTRFNGTALDFERLFWAAGPLFGPDFPHEIKLIFWGAHIKPL